MPKSFTSFIILAEMRTGSNYLETNLNSVPGVACHGEAFNPAFIGYPNTPELLGFSLEQREKDPSALLRLMGQQRGVIGGFRFFNDHDPRALKLCLADRHCAKIILTRNPFDSYVSLKIAQETGQWKLTNITRQRTQKIRFVADEFFERFEQLQTFQHRLQATLKETGQSAFYLAYDDLGNINVLNGLLRFLGVDARLEALDGKLKRQNTSSALEKVVNPEDVAPALALLDHFDFSRLPNFEPKRGPAVPKYIATRRAPLLFLPIPGGPNQPVRQWLADLDHTSPEALISGFSQKSLRFWKRQHPGHRAFTVLRHPALRAHHVFCSRILATGAGSLARIRSVLRKVHKVPLPSDPNNPGYDLARHREAFLGFLRFVHANHAGQTSVRIAPEWASQAQIIQGFSEFAAPDLIVREHELARFLPLLPGASEANAPLPAPAREETRYALDDIYDEDIENAVQKAFQRDYVTFGFAPYDEGAGIAQSP